MSITEKILNGIKQAITEGGKVNRSAVSQGQILRDVANTSQSIKLSLGNNDECYSTT